MEKQDKGFRNEKIKENMIEKLRANLTTEELQRIEAQRKFNDIEKDTHTYKIALHLDALRIQLRDEKQIIYKRLWNIENINNVEARCLKQIEDGDIYETLPDSNVVMNENEVKTYMKHQEWLRLGEVRAIAPSLAKIRSIVGHKDYVGQDILTEEEFNAYVEETMQKLEALGHSLYD